MKQVPNSLAVPPDELWRIEDEQGVTHSFYRHELTDVIAHQIAFDRELIENALWIQQQVPIRLAFFLRLHGAFCNINEESYNNPQLRDLVEGIVHYVVDIRNRLAHHFNEGRLMLPNPRVTDEKGGLLLLTERLYRPEGTLFVRQTANSDSFAHAKIEGVLQESESSEGWWEVMSRTIRSYLKL